MEYLSLIPLALSFLGGNRQQTVDPAEQFQKILMLLGPRFEKLRTALQGQYQRQGARAAQRVESQLGPAGGGSSGVGALARSFSAGFQTSAAQEADILTESQLLQLATQLFPGFQPSTYTAPQTPFQSFQSALGLTYAGGQDPVKQLVNLFSNFNKPKQQKPNFQEPTTFNRTDPVR